MNALHKKNNLVHDCKCRFGINLGVFLLSSRSPIVPLLQKKKKEQQILTPAIHDLLCLLVSALGSLLLSFWWLSFLSGCFALLKLNLPQYAQTVGIHPGPKCASCTFPECVMPVMSSSNPHERLSIWLVSRYTGTLSVQMNSPLVQFTSLTFRELLLTKNNNKILLLHIPLHPGCVGFKACQETVSLF